MKFALGRVDVRRRARLPHWDAEGGIYFVTFCLIDAIPCDVLLSIRAEADAQREHIRDLRGDLTIAEKRAIDEWVRAKTGDVLDAIGGASFMRDTRVAQVVADAIRYFDGERYDLLAWCVMPNHVHVVFAPRAGEQLAAIVHSWKSFTANRCNPLAGRRGPFWQDDYYERVIRDSRELTSTTTM